MLPSVGAKGTGRKLLGLFLFGGIFLALFVLLGIEIGFGSPAMPDGAVVVVEDAPSGIGTISMPELRKAVRQRASSAGIEVSEPNSDEYEALEQETLSEFVSAIWLAGQAAELGLPIPKQGGRPDLTKLQEAIEPKLREEAPESREPAAVFHRSRLQIPLEVAAAHSLQGRIRLRYVRRVRLRSPLVSLLRSRPAGTG